ncbi:MAG: DUF5694 domain-containing protein [Thermoanaerobaculia bacterium]
MPERPPASRSAAPRSRRPRIAVLAAAFGVVLAAAPCEAGEVMVVGTPHLSALRPEPGPERLQEVVDRLASWGPTVVCVEAIPGDRVRQLADEPGTWGELLSTFALDALRLAPEQQARLSVDGATALRLARELEIRPGPLTTEERVRLVGLQLAGQEPWSAVLGWSVLPEAERAAAAKTLGRAAAERLGALASSRNEIVSLAIPLAARLGHRRLCMADVFVDEVAVQALAEDLAPLLRDPGVAKGLEAFDAAAAARWRPEEKDGLVRLIGWTSSPAYAEADRRSQWDLFARDGAPNRAGARRLALWHARNAEIAAHVYRAVSGPDGARTLLVIGASHRPFLEAALRAQPWIDVVPAERALAAAGR